MDRLIEREKKYNQKKYVEYLLENPSLISDSHNYFSNLKLLVTYLKDEKGLKPKQREKFIYDFVEKNDIYYNKIIDYPKIDKALKAGSKAKLKVIQPIKVYKKEFEYINNLDLDISRKKVIFTTYCFSKLRDALYPQMQGSSYIPSRIVTIAKIKSSSNVKDDIRYYFNELQNKYFDWTAHGDTSVILPSINEMPECSLEDEFCLISNFDNLYLYYDYFLGDKSISFCKICGAAFRDKNYKKAGARQQYCKDCMKEKENKESFKIITCECCGKQSLVSTIIKRNSNLCDECYENYRKKDRHKSRNKDFATR